MTDVAEERPERLFIAVPLSEPARDALRKCLPANLPGRAVPAENWHFTLRFLGATPASVRDKIINQLTSRIREATFRIHFNQLGAFPNPRRARVLWVGIDRGADEMKKLARIAESVAREAGFEPERREFTSHLTVARLDPAANVSTLVSQPKLDISMAVDRVVVYRSRLGKGPARYEEVATFALAK